MSNLSQWLKQNKLQDYEEMFKQDGIETLNDLAVDKWRGDALSIKNQITKTTGEKRRIKVNKIYNAIKKLQVTLASDTDIKENSNNTQLSKVSDSFVRAIVQVENSSDIEKILKNEQNKKMVMQYEKRYYTINVHDAMIKLETSGNLLQLAYASSHGFSCQAIIVNLLSKYATLVKQTDIATGTFVETSITSLQYHKTAFDMLPNDIGKAIEIICLCCEQAKEMADIAEGLEKKTEDLILVAEKAFEQAVEDKTSKNKDKEQLVKKMRKTKAQRDELSKLIKKFNKDISDLQNQQFQTDAVKKQVESVQRLVLESMKRASQPILETATSLLAYEMSVADTKDNDDDDDDDEKKQPESSLIKQKSEILDKLMQQNDELMKTVIEIQSGEMDSFEKSLKSIEVVIKTLGKIKSIFSNVQLFWIGVTDNCKRLVQINKKVDFFKKSAVQYKDEFREAIGESTKGWFILTKVNCQAQKAICEVDKVMDKMLQNLPGEEKAMALVKESTPKMIEALREENKTIGEDQKRSANFAERMQGGMANLWVGTKAFGQALFKKN
eukprot:530116_1